MGFRHCAAAPASVLSAGLMVWTSAAAAAPAPSAPPSASDPRDAVIAALLQRVDALTQKVDALQAKVDAQATKVTPTASYVTPPASAPAPVIATLAPPAAVGKAAIPAGKPSIQSVDGRFTANLHAVMQFDAAAYRQGGAGPLATDLRRGGSASDSAHARDLSSGSNFRRARIGIDGRTFGDFEYNVLFEFGGAGEEDGGHIQELWAQYSGLKPFHLRIGAFPPSIGLEDQASTNGAPFLERPAIADIARGMAGGDYREAAEVWASGDRWYVSGAVTGRSVGVINSQATGVAQPYDAPLGLIGRVAFLPVKGDVGLLHLGLHGSYLARAADTGGPDAAANAIRNSLTFHERPELRVDGTRLISTGAIDVKHASTMGVEVAAQYRSLWVQAEWERLRMERRAPVAGVSDPQFGGYYLEGSWMLTGERRRYNTGTAAFDAPSIDHPFSLANRTWGAVELALRYSVTNLNYHAGAAGTAPTADAVRGGEQTIWAGGLNWYFNPVLRLMFDYQHVRIDRLSPSAASYVTPNGAQIGQNYDVLSVRSQMAF